MPPSPIIKPLVNELLFAKLLFELDDIDPPKVRFMPSPNDEWSGIYEPGPKRIDMFMGMSTYETDQLRFVSYELSRTLLHETRHHWQHETWEDFDFNADHKLPYRKREIEIDAYDFEDRRLADYRGLVKVRRVFPSTPFSRLAKTQATVRRGL